mgnify:CR=1 FL=1
MAATFDKNDFTLVIGYAEAMYIKNYGFDDVDLNGCFNAAQFIKNSEGYESMLMEHWVKQDNGDIVFRMVNAPIILDGIYDPNKTISGTLKIKEGSDKTFGTWRDAIVAEMKTVIEKVAEENRRVKISLKKDTDGKYYIYSVGWETGEMTITQTLETPMEADPNQHNYSLQRGY